MTEHPTMSVENGLPHADCDPLRHSVHGRDESSKACLACQRHAVESGPPAPACAICGFTRGHESECPDRYNVGSDNTPGVEPVAYALPPADAYACPTTGETESRTAGGFDVCCDHPECPGNTRRIPSAADQEATDE